MDNKNNLIYGRNPLKEALKANRVSKIFMIEDFKDPEINKLLENSQIKINKVNRSYLDSLCEGVHQGIAAEIKPYSYVSLEEILLKANKVERPVIILLDGINDPHNLGAIIRSADVFNVSGIIISKHNQVPLNGTVAKTSAGAINYVPVCLVNNLNQAIIKLKENGYWIVSTDGSATINYQDLKYDFKVGLVVGSEGNGISHLVLQNSDYIVKIPQFGKVNSLNASVATGILLSKIRQ